MCLPERCPVRKISVGNRARVHDTLYVGMLGCARLHIFFDNFKNKNIVKNITGLITHNRTT